MRTPIIGPVSYIPACELEAASNFLSRCRLVRRPTSIADVLSPQLVIDTFQQIPALATLEPVLVGSTHPRAWCGAHSRRSRAASGRAASGRWWLLDNID